jgi:hypothetical protein
MQRSQKLLDRHVGQFNFEKWAEADLFRTAFPMIFE